MILSCFEPHSIITFPGQLNPRTTPPAIADGMRLSELHPISRPKQCCIRGRASFRCLRCSASYQQHQREICPAVPRDQRRPEPQATLDRIQEPGNLSVAAVPLLLAARTSCARLGLISQQVHPLSRDFRFASAPESTICCRRHF